jgi:hypothetical protein
MHFAEGALSGIFERHDRLSRNEIRRRAPRDEFVRFEPRDDFGPDTVVATHLDRQQFYLSVPAGRRRRETDRRNRT